MSLENRNETLAQILTEWEDYGDDSVHKIVFTRLINIICWCYDYLIFRKTIKKDP